MKLVLADMTRTVQFLFLFAFPLLTFGQDIDPRIAPTKLPLETIELFRLPKVDNDVLRKEETARRQPGVAPRFAQSFEVNITPSTHGVWEQISATEAVWRLRLLSTGAYSINLGFTEFFLPAGSSLIVYDPGQQRVMGPFTPADNEAHAQLWTPVFDGDALVIELRTPIRERGDLRLRLGYVNHDFLGFTQLLSGNCNLDVACGARDGWPIVDRYRNAIQSVAIYGFGGDSFCTGFLVNNTRNDCSPYFMTAYHCGVNPTNAPSMVVYWNYQNSFCRALGSTTNGRSGDGRLNTFNSGARYRAGYNPTDFVLVELDDPVAPSANAYFAGWSAEAALPADTLACIHHPGSDEKRISFSFAGAYRGAWGRGAESVPNGNHLIVPRWNVGTTEIGSSGAPLFDRNQQVVGQLHGGLASCGNGQYDQFGWFHLSWTGGGTPDNSLRPWLDPDFSGILRLNGRRQDACSFLLQPQENTLAVCRPDSIALTVKTSAGFSAPVRLSLSGAPPGIRGAFQQATVSPGEQAALLLVIGPEAEAGAYELTLSATDGLVSATAPVSLFVNSEIPQAPQLQTPVNGEGEVNTFPEFTWTESTPGARYFLQVATDPEFRQLILEEANLVSNRLRSIALQPTTAYFWRVQAGNACGRSPWSATARFSTAAIQCDAWQARDIPLTISSSGTPTIVSEIDVQISGVVAAVEIQDLDITHSFVGDLKLTLTAPGGKTITLFDRPGFPRDFFGCEGDNLFLHFTDEAEQTADQLENTCQNQPAISGAFRPLDPLSAFQGEPAAGRWKLTLRDFNNEDGGSLNRWRLALCVAQPKDLSLTLPAERYDICPDTTATLSLRLGSGFNQNGVWLSADGPPEGVSVSFLPNPAPPGSEVSVRVSNGRPSSEFPLRIRADDGTNTAELTIEMAVRPPPAPAELLRPSDRAGEQPRQVLLQWRRADQAARYRLQVANNAGLADPIVEVSIQDTSYLLRNLDFQQQYYWRVVAVNDCAQQTPSAVYSFVTQADYSFLASTNRLGVCSNDNPYFMLSLGAGYQQPRLNFTIAPSAPLTLSFDPDLSTIRGGAVVRVILNDLDLMKAGQYQLTLSIAEGQFQDSLSVALEVYPELPRPELLSPGPDAAVGTPTPFFQWRGSGEAAGYRFEIAAQPDFTLPDRILLLPDTSLLLDDPLDPGRYFWRIVALGSCGEVASVPSSFSVNLTAAGSLGEQEIRLYPNPTRGDVWLRLRHPAPLTIELLAADGRSLLFREEPPREQFTFNLSRYPPGVYILRLLSGGAAAAFRIVRAD